MDVDRGMEVLQRTQPKAWAILVLCGKYGLDRRTVAEMIGYASMTSVNRLYTHGIKVLAQLMTTGRRR